MGRMLRELGERGLIEYLRDAIPGMETIGDDSAVLPSISCPVVTTDSFFEGTHFHRWWAPPDVLGRRLLEAALSDIAAMGARAGWVLAAACLDPGMDLDWLVSFYMGLACREDVHICGGETVSGPRFGLTLTAVGEGGDPDTLMRRSSLREGDVLWTGGPVGRALDAPALLEECGGLRGESLIPVRGDLEDEEVSRLRAFLTPRAQLDLAEELRARGVRCAIDISDGLFSEALHLCEESGVDIVLEIDGSSFLPSVRERPLEAAAAGEDFVLLCGAAPGTDLTDMGCLQAGRAFRGTGRLKVVLEGREVPVTATGYDHMEVSDDRRE